MGKRCFQGVPISLKRLEAASTLHRWLPAAGRIPGYPALDATPAGPGMNGRSVTPGSWPS
jgi:hypothetical protein